jgi:competence transcription factor ComK
VTFTNRQTALLQVALTNFYDEIAKTSTPQMKAEVMELAQMVQNYSMENNK